MKIYGVKFRIRDLLKYFAGSLFVAAYFYLGYHFMYFTAEALELVQ